MDNNKIGNHLRGGLGNQLFQIFTLISKAIDTNRDFYILHDASDKRPLYKQLYMAIIDKISSGYYHFNYNDPAIYSEKISRKYSEIPDNCSFLLGHYENSQYFHNNRDKIIKLLKFDEMQEKYKFEFNEKTIAIHFRFEDYIHLHLVQKPDYFIRALQKLKEELKEDFYNHKFIIFSSKGENDNYLTDKYIENINKNLESPIDFIKFADLYPNATTEEEFIYMSNCNHFIKPNSTFSWFAFYISPHINKKAIVPNNLEMYDGIDGFIIIESDSYETANIEL